MMSATQQMDVFRQPPRTEKMTKPIQVNVPYKMLLDNMDFVLEKELNPEIYFDSKALDDYQASDLIRQRRKFDHEQH